MHCGDPNEKEVQKGGIYVYAWLIDFAIQYVKQQTEEKKGPVVLTPTQGASVGSQTGVTCPDYLFLRSPWCVENRL